QLGELVERAVRAGAVHVTPIVLHLRPGVREVFWPWLRRAHPELVARYQRLYPRSQAAAGYRRAVEERVRAQLRRAWARFGRPPAPPSWRGGGRGERPPAQGAQLGLFQGPPEAGRRPGMP
ncbi:MAG: hypothetical protein KY434_02795, partial [Actinobacteria bacterium]|nr:hypothetical protein [Actinomycetota bacterium]